MSASQSKKWSEMTDTNLLMHIIIKCGTNIPYNDIAAEFGITVAALRSKIDRLKKKYKNSSGNGTVGDGAASDEEVAEASVVPKKRKRTVKAAGKSQRGKKVKVEEDEEEQVPDDEE